jgi:hypothetical protein
MRELMEIVRTEGDRQGKITLEILRRGKRETVWITPESRPEKIAGVAPGGEGGEGWGWGTPGQGEPNDMLRFFEQRLGDGAAGRPGQPFQFRVFGPGTVFNAGPPMKLEHMPNGLSVSIQKQDDQPAQITVQRGEETWHVTGDDPGSLEQLPDDVRPFVEQLLAGNGPTRIPLPAMPNIEIPNVPNMPNALVPPAPIAPQAFDSDALRQRLEEMEQHLEQMQEQLEKQFGQSHKADNTATE